jgi:hypothetical protein
LLEVHRTNLSLLFVAAAIAVLVIGSVSAHAEQADPQRLKTTSPPAPQPRLIIRADELFPVISRPRLGVLTLVPPQMDGEVIRVGIPVGELISRAARSISDANHRRAERRADERVRQDLEQFLAAAANGRKATAP